MLLGGTGGTIVGKKGGRWLLLAGGMGVAVIVGFSEEGGIVESVGYSDGSDAGGVNAADDSCASTAGRKPAATANASAAEVGRRISVYFSTMEMKLKRNPEDADGQLDFIYGGC